ncbi:MAG: AAA family ATPase [Alkalispirochaeta sp.]
MELHLDTDKLPLAARLRPRTLDEFFGQQQIIGPGRLLRRAIQADQLSSILLSGPPGTGKTTLARIIAARTQSQFLTLNAVLSGVKDIRGAIDEAKEYRNRTNRRTILFVDEVHRWNKSQQDALLPWVEDGLFVLIGATTENPFFEVNRALLSRSRVFLLTPLSENDLDRIIDTALKDRERGYGAYRIEITPEARKHLVSTASGDARTLLNALELAVETSGPAFPPSPKEVITIDLTVAEDSIQRRAVLYDKDGDYHFDTISAFIKSVRGSDPDASLYWLARMLEAGEDPHYIFRRLIVQASEDIGLADPSALGVVVSCADAFDRVGLPEGRFHLAQATLYLATTEKSNSTLGLFDAIAAVRERDAGEVPHHLRDANRDGADLGHGAGYLYPHAYTDHWVAQRYLPDSLKDAVYYQPGHLGWEGARDEKIRERRLLQLAIQDEVERTVWSVPPDTLSGRWRERTAGMIAETEPLRDAVFGTLNLSGTDRVLLEGTAVKTFVPEMYRRVTGGVTVVVTDALSVDALEHTFPDAQSRVDAPQIHRIDAFPGDGYAGPFDLIVARYVTPGDPEDTVRRLAPYLDERGVLKIVEIDISEGDRPSRFLDALPGEIASALSDVERELHPPRRPLWDTLDPGTFDLEHAAPGDQEVVVETARFLDGTIVTGWFAPGSPLGENLRGRLSREDIAVLEKAAGAVVAGEYPWRRIFRIQTFRRISALTKST